MSLSLKSGFDGVVQIDAFILSQPWMMYFFGILCDERIKYANSLSPAHWRTPAIGRKARVRCLRHKSPYAAFLVQHWRRNDTQTTRTQFAHMTGIFPKGNKVTWPRQGKQWQPWLPMIKFELPSGSENFKHLYPPPWAWPLLSRDFPDQMGTDTGQQALLIGYNVVCQRLEALNHSAIGEVTKSHRHGSNVQKKRKYLIVTENEVFYESASGPMLQVTFKKLPLASFWCRFKEEYWQLSEGALKNSLST